MQPSPHLCLRLHRRSRRGASTVRPEAEGRGSEFTLVLVPFSSPPPLGRGAAVPLPACEEPPSLSALSSSCHYSGRDPSSEKASPISARERGGRGVEVRGREKRGESGEPSGRHAWESGAGGRRGRGRAAPHPARPPLSRESPAPPRPAGPRGAPRERFCVRPSPHPSSAGSARPDPGGLQLGETAGFWRPKSERGRCRDKNNRR